MAEAKTQQRVYEKIRTDIVCGTYRYQDDLPSISVLCERFSVGRNTIRSVLKKLEEEHLIKQEKGRNACIMFDVNQPQFLRIYQQTLIGRLPAMMEIFQTMEYIMPEIVEDALCNADREDLRKLQEKIASLKKNPLDTSRSMLAALMDVYLYAFSLLENDHVIDLFREMMQFVTVLVPKYSMQRQEMKKSVQFLGIIMSTIMDFVVRSDTAMMKKGVRLMARSSSRKLVHYVERHVDPKISFVSMKFHWHYHEDYLYQEMMADIINDIYLGTYRMDEPLPSFQQLAIQYHVSVRTSRKAMEQLNAFHIVKTVNGVGSFINAQEDMQRSMQCNKEIIQHVKDYCEALQLLYLCIRGIGQHLLHQLKEQQVKTIIQDFETLAKPSLDPLLRVLFSYHECLWSIYEEIQKDLIWCVYVRHVIPYEQAGFDYAKREKELIIYLKDRQYEKVNNLMVNLVHKTYEYTKQSYEQLKCRWKEQDF